MVQRLDAPIEDIHSAQFEDWRRLYGGATILPRLECPIWLMSVRIMDRKSGSVQLLRAPT